MHAVCHAQSITNPGDRGKVSFSLPAARRLFLPPSARARNAKSWPISGKFSPPLRDKLGMVSGKMKSYSQFRIPRNGSSDLPSCAFHVPPHWRWSHQNTPGQASISASGFFLVMSVLALFLVPAMRAQSKDEAPRVTFDDDANYYSKAVVDGPVARLQKRIEEGQVNLKY